MRSLRQRGVTGRCALILACLTACVDGSQTRTVTHSVPSPDGQWVATIVNVSGGGAAGYAFDDVLLTRSGAALSRADSVTAGTQLRGVTLKWGSPTRLRVGYAHAFRAGGARFTPDSRGVALDWVQD